MKKQKKPNTLLQGDVEAFHGRLLDAKGWEYRMMIDGLPIMTLQCSTGYMKQHLLRVCLKQQLGEKGYEVDAETLIKEGKFGINFNADPDTAQKLQREIDAPGGREKLLGGAIARMKVAVEYFFKHLPEKISLATYALEMEALAKAETLIASERGDGSTPTSEQLESILKDIELTERDRSKRRLGLKESGQPSRWERQELVHAVMDAQKELIKRERTVTYNSVTDILKITFPDKAPPTGEALRVLLARFKINWKELKSVQYF